MNRFAILLSFVCTACTHSGDSTSHHISGAYRSDDGKNTFVFHDDQKVSAVFFGREETTSYAIQDNKVSLQFEGGVPFTFTINPDGSLTSLTSTHYSKQ
jgi:hypothetical protein